MNALKLVELGLKLAPPHDGLIIPEKCWCLLSNLSPNNYMTKNCLAGYKHTHSTNGKWNMTEQELINAIKGAEAELDHLQAIKTKSKKISSLIEEQQKLLKSLADILDSK